MVSVGRDPVPEGMGHIPGQQGNTLPGTWNIPSKIIGLYHDRIRQAVPK
ncbi:hypothetical protein C4K39_2634 [Pseudomonas sessilinigenes]|nr:hypothetical protein C4K39_2634 [Pseudomonas sessilinigenes]